MDVDDHTSCATYAYWTSDHYTAVFKLTSSSDCALVLSQHKACVALARKVENAEGHLPKFDALEIDLVF